MTSTHSGMLAMSEPADLDPWTNPQIRLRISSPGLFGPVPGPSVIRLLRPRPHNV